MNSKIISIKMNSVLRALSRFRDEDDIGLHSITLFFASSRRFDGSTGVVDLDLANL